VRSYCWRPPLGHVAQRRQDLRDITASLHSTQDRLDEATAERRGLLKALGDASSQNRIESLRTFGARLARARRRESALDAS